MDPILGEIKLFAIKTLPAGWLPCDGRLIQIQQNQALYSLLGTYYGGDGRTTFALPDLRGRVPVAHGNAQIGVSGGTETVTLSPGQVPPHTHNVFVYAAAGDQASGLGQHIAAPANSNNKLYGAAAGAVALNPATVDTQGGSGNHNNMQPFLALNYYIATAGTFPQRN